MNNNLNVINEGDSFTQYSQISGLNENHFYQEINYQPSFNDIVSNKQLLIEDIEGDLFFNHKLFKIFFPCDHTNTPFIMLPL